MTTGAPFDAIAARYDELWTNTGAGRLQREAVWRDVDPLFRRGDCILDLGCGTGEDALHFSRGGIRVSAFDASAEMVGVARDRGVDAGVLAIEHLEKLAGTYNGALSNFGAFNCVRDIEALRDPLARLIRSGGSLAICVIGRFCLRETLHYLRRGEVRKALRRWSGESRSGSLGLRVFYPTVSRIERALSPDFALKRASGIGLCVPPSYIPISARKLDRAEAIDRRLAHRLFFRGLADHRLLIFKRQ